MSPFKEYNLYDVFLFLFGCYTVYMSVRLFIQSKKLTDWLETKAIVNSITIECVEFGSGDAGWIEVVDISYSIDGENYNRRVKYRKGLNYFYAPFNYFVNKSGLKRDSECVIYYNPQDYSDITFAKTRPDYFPWVYLVLGVVFITISII